MALSLIHRLRMALLAGVVATLVSPGCVNAQPILKRVKQKDWTLNISVNVRAWQQRLHDIRPDEIPSYDVWKFDQTSIVFPINRLFSTAELNERGVTSRLTFGGRDVRDAFKGYVTGYHSGTRLGKWGITNATGREFRLTISLPYTCYETELNEESAVRAVWPEVWPEEAASTFEPQMFIDYAPGGRPYDMKIIDKMVKKWTRGDVKKVHPLVAAKLLAGKVIGQIRNIGGSGLGNNRNGEVEGVALRGVPVIARSGRGNEFELTCFLASVYRRAGIPARTVTGWDVSDDEDKFLGGRNKTNELRSWVEFALFDPQRDQVVWIPVDIQRLWEDRNRGLFTGSYFNYPLEHFGTIEDSDRVIPFAFQFHPPTTVRSYGSPGFWGWLMLPESPEGAQQSVRFNASSTPKSGNDRPKRDRGYPDED